MMSSRILRLTDSLDMKLEVLNLKSVKEKVKAYALLGVRTGRVLESSMCTNSGPVHVH